MRYFARLLPVRHRYQLRHGDGNANAYYKRYIQLQLIRVRLPLIVYKRANHCRINDMQRHLAQFMIFGNDKRRVLFASPHKDKCM